MNLTDGQLRHRLSTSAVLEFAWDAGAFRADHVMAALGLTRSTALAALGTLIELGLISELPSAGPEEGYRLGRPARRFELRAEAGVLVGIDAGERQFTAIAADLTGRVLARQRFDLRGFSDASEVRFADLDPRERTAAAFRAIDAVLDTAGRTRADVIGVGVGMAVPLRRLAMRRPSGVGDPEGAGGVLFCDLRRKRFKPPLGLDDLKFALILDREPRRIIAPIFEPL